MKIPTLFASFSQKSFKKGLTKFFCGCIMQSVKAMASLSVNILRDVFYIQAEKINLYVIQAMASVPMGILSIGRDAIFFSRRRKQYVVC